MDCIEHITRLARILRADRGCALLAGVSGMGKRSITRLGSHLCCYKCFELQLNCTYDHSSFLDDIRRLYFNAGAKNEPTTFLLTDSQILHEEFLEDISNILNSGEIPNLYQTAGEYDKVIQGTKSSAQEAGITDEVEIFAFFISRVRRNLHLVLCMSPVGEAFRRRCRMFPSLLNYCTVDWYVDWPQDALLSVAQDALRPLGEEVLVNNLSNICVLMHESVIHTAVRFCEEMRVEYYTTPSSYLELIKLYKIMLEEKRDNINEKKDRISNGLQKLFETNSVVEKMKAEFVALEPKLKERSAATAELMKHLVKEQSLADKVRQIVLSDEAVVKAKAAETQILADDAQRDLDAAVPAMDAATKALDSLNKNDMNELRAMGKPPHLVKFVMEAICLLLGRKLDWTSAKLVLGDADFIKKLQGFEKDKISDALLKKLKEYIEHPDFLPEKVATQSKVCRSMCMWVRAIDMYAKIYRVVEPKKKRLEETGQDLNQVMGVVRDKQQHLAEVEKHIAQLEASYDANLAEKTELERVIDLTANRLTRAGRLTSALGDEQVLWEESVKGLSASLSTLLGDVLVAAGYVVYLGPFTRPYRDELLGHWISHCKELSVPASEDFSLTAALTDSYEIRQWNVFGLPRDRVSTENAILATRAKRWPLLIDPQEQASRWIRQMENANGLKITKVTDPNFMHVLESGVRAGNSVLLEGVGETLHPTLHSVLLKQPFVQGGRSLIRLGDADVEYNDNFRLYMTTRHSNLHYLPEICNQMTIINFAVTASGLEEKLLSDIVYLEEPDLEQQRNELITRINNDKNQLQNIEEKVLRLLYASEGNILDNEALIDTLNESKETASIIASRLLEAEATEQKISVAREKYRIVATCGSILYSVVAQLADIDPMYQFSVKYFNQVFNKVISNNKKLDELEVRLQILLNEITLAVYTNVSRGLFERHKLVFSFLLCASICKQAGTINELQWNFLLRGPASVGMTVPKKPDIATLSDAMWLSVTFLATKFDSFGGLLSDASLKICIRIEDFYQLINVQATNQKSSQIDWNAQLDNFEKLMLLKALKEEKLASAIASYVKGKLGQAFVESPQITLQKLYRDTTNLIPLLFVLSSGSDPVEALQRFASEMGYRDRTQSISLGQEQGPLAEKMISLGRVKGDWVFIQNCHLEASWMLRMERIILKLSESPEKVHPDFRLYLSSMPSKAFPVSILQNSIKVTIEPPNGLRANMKRAFLELTADVFEDHPLGPQWRKMIFGLCFFHAVIQERRKFGPLGWNTPYEFNDSDRERALNTMKMFCFDDQIPWDVLEYIIADVTYGARVTDYWDLRCLKTILRGFFAPATLVDGYLYSESGVYYCPEFRNCSTLAQYRSFIDTLPIIEGPEIFGMHENADFVFQVKETQALIMTVMDIQPRESPGSAEKSNEDIVYELAETILRRLIEPINVDERLPSILQHDGKGRLPPLSTVLLQEVERYNRLLVKVSSSLNDLQKGIRGLTVMSDALEEVFESCLKNQVPKMWGASSYPSLKRLGSWISDLELRLDFMKVWLIAGPPPSYWMSGFFFPQGFLTGVLQTYACKHSHPVDELKFDFMVLKVNLSQEDIYTAHMANGQFEVPEAYGDIMEPKDGVIVHGLFVHGGRWDSKNMILADPYPGEMNPPLPAMHILPKSEIDCSGNLYEAPLYKTSIRADTVSATGHSTSFVVAVSLPSNQQQSYWILKGTALLTQIAD